MVESRRLARVQLLLVRRFITVTLLGPQLGVDLYSHAAVVEPVSPASVTIENQANLSGRVNSWFLQKATGSIDM